MTYQITDHCTIDHLYKDEFGDDRLLIRHFFRVPVTHGVGGEFSPALEWTAQPPPGSERVWPAGPYCWCLSQDCTDLKSIENTFK